MFRTAAPVRPQPGAASGPPVVPRLVRAARYAPSAPVTGHVPVPELEEFYAELGAPYGVPFDREGYADSARRTSVELAFGALDALGELPAEQAPELVVVAYTTPDFHHAELVASCVKGRLPGEPLAFALSDQGPLTAFSALRVAVEYARRCGFGRLLVLVVDQSTQPFAVPDAAAAVHRDCAVALLLEWGGGAAAVGGMAQGPLAAPDLFAGWDPGAGVVAGAGLADADCPSPSPDVRLATAGPGLPCTGVWAALLDVVSRGFAGPVVVADYDPGRGLLAYNMLDCTAVELPTRGNEESDDGSGRRA
ncbi:hypothetical protein [Streptomyces sp. AC512_CC834]|uniref:hypothetical protein n=1 Tax=Streptomyces sp. AC512_CC834 TaxID=2823691 RepID=UPI001C26DF06|nr:hypothetical protein [Streptomyces sp. AC512_CC834]